MQNRLLNHILAKISLPKRVTEVVFLFSKHQTTGCDSFFTFISLLDHLVKLPRFKRAFLLSLFLLYSVK